jgi:thiol:disulfide interchange protein DsbC
MSVKKALLGIIIVVLSVVVIAQAMNKEDKAKPASTAAAPAKEDKAKSATTTAAPASSKPATTTSPAAATNSDVEAIKAALRKEFPDASPDSITRSPIAGLYEVVFGPKIYYVSARGQYLINGSIFNLKTQKNMTAQRAAIARSQTFVKLGNKNMIVFQAPKQKYVISVFTDIDCPYCRLMHSQIKKYLKRGITVRYLLFPRAGVGSESYVKAVSVWCAKNHSKAFTLAKAGLPVKQKTCKNPVRRHMLLGRLMNVTGTPSIIKEDGKMIPGYVPPAQLQRILDGKEQAE